VAAIETTVKRSNVLIPQLCKRFGGISSKIIAKTLESTTQYTKRTGDMPLHCRFKTAQQQLRYNQLKFTMYTDMFKASCKSARGNLWAQLYTNASGWVYVHPMSHKSHAPDSLKHVMKRFGIPNTIHADNAKEVQQGVFRQIASQYSITMTSTEPHSPWQNRAKSKIREHKKMARSIIQWQRVPHQLWDYVSEYVSEVQSSLALPMNNF
jgi:hypothetical protein